MDENIYKRVEILMIQVKLARWFSVSGQISLFHDIY